MELSTNKEETIRRITDFKIKNLEFLIGSLLKTVSETVEKGPISLLEIPLNKLNQTLLDISELYLIKAIYSKIRKDYLLAMQTAAMADPNLEIKESYLINLPEARLIKGPQNKIGVQLNPFAKTKIIIDDFAGHQKSLYAFQGSTKQDLLKQKKYN